VRSINKDKGIMLKWKKWVFLAVVALIPILSGCEGCHKKKYVAPPPAPFAPFDLTATAISSTQIDLIWKETSENEKGFYVYRKTTGSYSKIAVLDPNTTSYSDLPLNPETTYWYKVSAYSDDQESSPSNEASATTLADVEILDYRMNKYYNSYSEEWDTYIAGSVKNNTSRILIIWIKGKFFSYRDSLIATEETRLNNVDPHKVREFWIYHRGKTEIERVEVWVDEYY